MKKIMIILLLLLVSLSINKVHAQEEILGPELVYKEADKIVTASDISLLYQSPGRYINAKDGFDNYTGNGNTLGTYSITLEALNGINAIERVVEVKVIREIGNVMLVANNGDIYLRPNQELTASEIKKVLSNVGIIQIPAGTGEQLIADEYTENKTIPGKYNYKFKLLYTSGYVHDVDIDIYVVDGFTDIDLENIIPGNPPININIKWIGNVVGALISIALVGGMVYGFYQLYKKFKRA